MKINWIDFLLSIETRRCNRAKRRLREVARVVLPQMGRDGWDYVLVGRRDLTASLPFETLVKDMRRAMRKVHG